MGVIVAGVAAGTGDEGGSFDLCVDIGGGVVVGGEAGAGESAPATVFGSHPSLGEAGDARVRGGVAVAAEVFDERVKPAQQLAVVQGRERRQVLPGRFLRDVEISRIPGARAVGFGGHKETVRLSDFPVVVEERLPAGAFAAEAAG